MQKLPVTAIILTKNEQLMIANCIECLSWCQEIIVVDSQSTDSTVQLAKRAGAIVYSTDKESFAERRNYGLLKVRTPWVLYIDADERVIPELLEDISQFIQNPPANAMAFRRMNIHYGKYLQHGGWEHDVITRFFVTEKLKGWKGSIHESAIFQGKSVEAKHLLVHLTHRNMVDGLIKSAQWTGYEAQLLFDAKHPAVTVRMLLRKTVMEFFRRAFQKKGRKDGMEGWIEAMVQAMNRFIVYERLWELQHKPSLDQTYSDIDKKIIDSWEELERA